ncbi:transposase [Glutamicibacter sp. ZJUTW]|nr:integrase core domain-containing protein [Glutamicibacter sp. ZJUTW]QEP06383.1 transposase [Glutamicibacter sp. ZJUTW]
MWRKLSGWRYGSAARAQGLVKALFRAPCTTRTRAEYTSQRYTQTLATEGLIPSIGSIGDAFDNAAAETVMGLFKNEAVARDSPFRTGTLAAKADVDDLVVEWVQWYNHARLHSTLGYRTPVEFEELYYDEMTETLPNVVASKLAA